MIRDMNTMKAHTLIVRSFCRILPPPILLRLDFCMMYLLRFLCNVSYDFPLGMARPTLPLCANLFQEIVYLLEFAEQVVSHSV